MPQTTTIDAHGNARTEITFDHEAFEAWKAARSAFRRSQYVANPGIRAARKATNAAAYSKRKAAKQKEISK